MGSSGASGLRYTSLDLEALGVSSASCWCVRYAPASGQDRGLAPPPSVVGAYEARRRVLDRSVLDMHPVSEETHEAGHGACEAYGHRLLAGNYGGL